MLNLALPRELQCSEADAPTTIDPCPHMPQPDIVPVTPHDTRAPTFTALLYGITLSISLVYIDFYAGGSGPLAALVRTALPRDQGAAHTELATPVCRPWSQATTVDRRDSSRKMPTAPMAVSSIGWTRQRARRLAGRANVSARPTGATQKRERTQHRGCI